MTLLGFALEVYQLQLDAGRHFLHEHPAAASSWRVAAVQRLRQDPRVAEIVGHQCRFGLSTRGPGGVRMPAMKPARFLSSSGAILEQLGLRCRGAHRHQPLLGGGRAGAAAIYPPGLCKAILVGAQVQLQRDRGAVPASVQQVMVDGTGVFALDEEFDSGSAMAREPGACCRDGQYEEHNAGIEEYEKTDDYNEDEPNVNQRLRDCPAGAACPSRLLHAVRLPQYSHPADGRLWPEAGGPLLPDEADAFREYWLQPWG